MKDAAPVRDRLGGARAHQALPMHREATLDVDFAVPLGHSLRQAPARVAPPCRLHGAAQEAVAPRDARPGVPDVSSEASNVEADVSGRVREAHDARPRRPGASAEEEDTDVEGVGEAGGVVALAPRLALHRAPVLPEARQCRAPRVARHDVGVESSPRRVASPASAGAMEATGVVKMRGAAQGVSLRGARAEAEEVRRRASAEEVAVEEGARRGEGVAAIDDSHDLLPRPRRGCHRRWEDSMTLDR